MKKLVLFILAVLVLSTSAYGQAGIIGIFANPGGTNCNLPDDAPGVVSYYIVHIETTGAMACQFSAPAPSCLLGSWLSDTPIFPVVIGDSQTGVAVGYGTCQSEPIHVLTVNYFVQGQSEACCRYHIRPDPLIASGQIEIADCFGELLYGIAGTGVVKPNASCRCNSPVQEGTWGQVKSQWED
jgi:hypothetical protein